MAKEADEAKRYRLLAARARQSAGRTTDGKVSAAYEDIAKQYDQLAAEMEKLAQRKEGRELN